MAFTSAFQRNAFQQNAFQIRDLRHDAGSRITGGTFSRGRWRDIKEQERQAHLRALAEREREKRRRKELREREAAERAAKALTARQAEDEANALAAQARLLAGANQVGPAVDSMMKSGLDATAMSAMAREAAMRKVQEDAEDEALALMLLGQ